jgi:hypothetical protein
MTMAIVLRFITPRSISCLINKVQTHISIGDKILLWGILVEYIQMDTTPAAIKKFKHVEAFHTLANIVEGPIKMLLAHGALTVGERNSGESK